MFALGLLTCIVLRAFSTQAKVVTSFGECKDFFYKNTEPGGMDQNAKKICQKYGEGGRYYYATLYSVSHRIPLYSAYTLDSACSSTPGVSCGKKWYVEPQISQLDSQPDYMVLESNFDKNIIKKNQAIYSDYTNSGYDRSHLNPNSFQCGTGRTSTCTLTNAAPMKAYFNRIHWNRWESTLRRLLKDNHVRDGASATAYIVTGTVPSSNERIPKRGTSGDSERVTVPSHIWTAVCYKHLTDDTKSFSFGFMGRNQPAEPGINLINVSNLNDQLSDLYSQLSETWIRIFADDCGEDNNKLNMIREKFQKLINQPVNQGSEISPDAQNTHGVLKRAISGDSTSSKRNVKVRTVTADLGFDSMYCHSNHACAKYGYGYMWCYTDDKGIWDYCSTSNDCHSAKNGKTCRSDHACGFHDYNYVWCYTTDGSWDYCCTSDDCYSAVKDQTCRSDHLCGYHGYKYLWCYTDDKDNWDYCCKDCSH